MKRFALFAPLLLLAACSGERATADDFYAVAPQVLRFMEQDARQNQPGRPADGPLYVNLMSFRSASDGVTGTPLNQDSISRILGEPTQAILQQALLCDTMSSFGGCWVRKYGIWINWNLAHGTPNEIRGTVRSTSTNRGTRPTNFCDRVWRLTFRKQAGRWALADRELIADCRKES
jgi:hypothetical protein